MPDDDPDAGIPKRYRPRYYTLDADGEPVPAGEVLTWAQWMETVGHGRTLRVTRIGPYAISTVFLGTDHNFCGEGDPILWETMVFAGPESDLDCRRYTSRAEALAGHQVTCDLVALRVEQEEGHPALREEVAVR